MRPGSSLRRGIGHDSRVMVGAAQPLRPRSDPAPEPLIPKHFDDAPRIMARRLLPAAAVQSLAMRSLLAGLLIYAIGCVVPTPLEQEGDPPANHSPVIVSGEPDFASGPYTPFHADDVWNFEVTADDPDVDDTLEARLYRLDGARLLPVPSPIFLTAPDADHLTRRSGQFFGTAYCEFSGAMPQQEYLFYVYVSDLPFPASGSPGELRDGHYDYKYWVVRCP